MNDSRSNFRLACAACIGGHIGYVQKWLNDRTTGSGRNARRFNIAACDGFAIRREQKIAKIICGKPLCNHLKRKTLVTSAFETYAPLFPWQKTYQKLGSSEKKYHARTFFWKRAQRTWSGRSISLHICRFPRRRVLNQPAEARPAQQRSSLHAPAQISPHRARWDSAKEFSRDMRGEPTITRKTSTTKRAIAISLNNIARGESGQNWFAAQKRKATANKTALRSSVAGGRWAIW